MDIKNQPEKYPLTVGVSVFDIAPVQESVQLLARSGVDYEFRTTAVREFHTAEDFLAIGRWLEGAPRYFIQNFVDSGNLVGHRAATAFPPRNCRLSRHCSSRFSARWTCVAFN